MSRSTLFKCDPEKSLVFQKGDPQNSKTTLTITNLNQQSIAYKVKTTKPKHYIVRPNQGIIESDTNVSIEISCVVDVSDRELPNRLRDQKRRRPLSFKSKELFAN